jgi:hypothetical protein
MMIPDESSPKRLFLPFVFRFAERLPEVVRSPLRYDSARQISQALVGSKWVDSPDASAGSMPSTRCTKVKAETTDDE